MKKFAVIIILVLGLFFFFQATSFYQNKTRTRETSQSIKKIVVQQKINTENFKRYEIEEKKTALDLLKQTSAVVTKGEKENAYVTEINGRKAGDAKKEFWSFYINDKMSPVGAGSYLLKNEDKIEWKIEKY